MKFEHAIFEFHAKLKTHLLVKRLYRTLELDRQGKALAVYFFAYGHFYPALADAIRLYVKALFAVKPNAHRVLEYGGNVVRAAGVGGQLVGQVRARGCWGRFK